MRIKIDKEVFAKLQERATPFLDEPNDVLRRLLGLQENKKAEETLKRISATRISGRYLLHMGEYQLPILRSLDRQGGTAARKSILTDVFEELKKRFTPHDLDRLNDNPPRWQVRTEIVRSQMSKKNLYLE